MKKALIMAGIIWGIVGCTMSDRNYSALDKEVNFTGYNTFAWLPKDSAQIQNVFYDNQIVAQSIRKSVNDELISRGFQVQRDTPDVLLQYTILVERREQKITSVQAVPDPNVSYYNQAFNMNATSAYDSRANLYYYSNPNGVYNQNFNSSNYPYYTNFGYPMQIPYYVNKNIYEEEFKEGTLIIDIIDRTTGELIWRGWNKDILYDPQSYNASIPEGISNIFKNYPSAAY